jgi:hypothetical protein
MKRLLTQLRAELQLTLRNGEQLLLTLGIPVLLLVLICQLVSATLIGVLADSWVGPWGILAATISLRKLSTAAPC